MLERIEEIQGIGLLHSAKGKPYTCQKATLIYADNGRGKSTLAAVLRSLSTGDPSLIKHRGTVDGTLAAKVVLQFDSGHKVTFIGQAWSEQRPEVLVFDADFIERNVYSGGEVNTGHRKNLLEFALGEPAVAARATVDKATANAKNATEKVRSLTEQLSGHHANLTLAQFEALPIVTDADVQLVELQKRITAASNIAVIIAKVAPALVAVPTLDLASLFTALKTSLTDVHNEAEQVVKQHIQKLGNGAAEGWLSQGKQFGDADTCPYCGQDTKSSNLIKAYQTHFNTAYAAIKSKVAALSSIVSVGAGASIVDVFSQSVAMAKAQTAAWNEHIQTQPINFEDEAAHSSLAELREFLLDLVRRKQATPAESVSVESDYGRAVALWQKSVAPMQATNEAIKAASALIATYKGKLVTDKAEHLQMQVRQLEASKRRHTPVVVDIFTKLASARADGASAETAKKAEREKLDALMTTTLKQYQQSINALLKNFGASFSIKNMGANEGVPNFV